MKDGLPEKINRKKDKHFKESTALEIKIRNTHKKQEC